MKAIAAMALNRVIGADGRMPWHLPDDFRWFKRTTLGHSVLMGRKTFVSLGKPLPGRRNFVASRGEALPGVEMVRDLAAFDAEAVGGEVWLIGGAELYAQLLPRCSELYLSVVQRVVEGETRFPPFEHLFAAAEVLERFPEFEIRRYRRLAV